MFRICIPIAVMLLAACGSQPAKREHKGRIISLTDTILETGGTDTVRFGRMNSGEIAQLRLSLGNDATRVTAVTSYQRSCGCTMLEYDPQPIAPGESRQLTITFDSRGEWGWQLKTLDISLAGATKPLRLFVEAEVK